MKLKNFPDKLNGKTVKRDAKDVSDYPAHVYCHDMKGKKKIDLQYIILLFIWIAACLIEGFSSRYGESVLLFAAIINAACFIINAVLGFLFLMGRLEEKLIYLFFFALCIIVLTERFLLRYGEYVLLITGIKNIAGFVLLSELVLGLHFLTRGGENKNVKKRLSKIFLMMLFLLPIFYLGKTVVDIGMDAASGPVSIDLTDSSYNIRHGRRVKRKNITGMNNGIQYTFTVNGCSPDLGHEIERSHPAIRITYYKRSRVVKNISILK